MRVLRSAATTERLEKKAAAALPDIAETPALRLTGSDDALYERHLAFDNVVRLKETSPRVRFEALARSVRDVLTQRWLQTEEVYEREIQSGFITSRWSFLSGARLLTKPSRTFFFAGKAAPAYELAKVIIKFINNLAAVIDSDPLVAGRMKVLFLPDYNVTLAERLIPASNVSNQISTAGYEASGTSNMKFMMNGALTLGTRDGATIEMAAEAGEENFFLFGLSAEQVSSSRGWYNAYWHYDHEPETRAALDFVFSDYFCKSDRGILAPLKDALLTHGDYYMHLADLNSYLEADARLVSLYAEPDAWARKAILNAASGKFSSDRTIAEYAAGIWNIEPCPVS